MKLKHIAVSLAMIGTALGGSVTVTNVNAGSSQVVHDNVGNPVVGGFVGVGTISDTGADFGSLDGAGVAALFTPFDTATGLTIDPPGNPLLDLSMSFNVVGSANFDTSPLGGQPIFLVIGNGATLEGSSQVGILNVGTFPSSEPTPPNPVIMAQATSTVVYGDYSGTASNGGGVTSGDRPVFVLGNLVPEPSSSLLVSLAGLGLLIRRKR